MFDLTLSISHPSISGQDALKFLSLYALTAEFDGDLVFRDMLNDNLTKIKGIQPEDCRDIEEFTENSWVKYVVTNLCVIRPGELTTYKPFINGGTGIRFNKIAPLRALEIMRQDKALASQKANINLKQKIAEQESRHLMQITKLKEEKDSLEEAWKRRCDNLKLSTSDLKTEIDKLLSIIRSAAVEVGNSRRFVRSNQLAALRKRLEDVLPPKQEGDDFGNYHY